MPEEKKYYKRILIVTFNIIYWEMGGMKMRTHEKGKEERMGTGQRQQIKDRTQPPEISNLCTNG